MNTKFMRLVIDMGLISFFLIGCSAVDMRATVTAPTAVVQPSEVPIEMSGVNYTGRLILQTDSGVNELRVNSSTNKVEQTLIAPNAKFAAISPDKSYLLYYYDPDQFSSSDDEVRLLSLKTGELQTVMTKEITSRIECFSWSPTNTKFSAVVDDSLEIFDLSGNVFQVVDGSPSALYAPNGKGTSVTFHGLLDCGIWISPDRLIFQKSSSMPTNASDIAYDTTTLAILSGTVTLKNAPERWYVLDSCMESNLTILVNERGQVFLVSAFQDFISTEPRTLVTTYDWIHSFEARDLVGFIPDSNCEIYYQNLPIGYMQGKGEIHSLNPKGLQEDFVYTVDVPRGRWTGTWVGASQNKLIALIEDEETNWDVAHILILDPKTGSGGLLAKITSKNTKILDWLP